jgi:polar amino acid transport system substrate-binding protein
VTGARIRSRSARARLGQIGWRLLGAGLSAVLAIGFGSVGSRAHTLSQILDRKAFSICADPDGLPFSSRTGTPPGLQIDLAQIIAERLGVQLDVGWVVFRRSARTVDCDAIMSSIAREDVAGHSELPEKTVRQSLSRPYARLVTRLVVGYGVPAVTSFADLKKIMVAVPPASYLHYLLDTHQVPVRTRYTTDLEILDAVAGGEVPAGIASDWYLGWYRKTHPDARISVDDDLVLDPDLDYNVAITLRNTDQELVDAVNRILTGLLTDGGMVRIFDKYGIQYRLPLAH